MEDRPRLRDSKHAKTSEPYPINEIPDEIIKRIGRYFVYLIATGRKDITGSDWGDAFAYAIRGKHLDSPVGIADILLDKMAWSAKTVKHDNPFSVKKLRLISGRCSPDYSYGINDVHEDLAKTGRAVLGIWNERINIAHDSYNPVRTIVLVRSSDLLNYRIFEEDTNRFRTNDFEWTANTKGNFLGTNIQTGETKFTWQPHGSQFTIHTPVPVDAIKFSIRKPSVITREQILSAVNFDESWVEIIR